MLIVMLIFLPGSYYYMYVSVFVILQVHGAIGDHYSWGSSAIWFYIH